jgi:integrase
MRVEVLVVPAGAIEVVNETANFRTAVHPTDHASRAGVNGQLVGSGRSAGTARRALSTFRSILDHAIADQRLIRNVAATAKVPRGPATREGQALTDDEVATLAAACQSRYRDLVAMLAHTGLR